MQFQDASYHAYNRGNRRERLFRSDRDYQTFEDYMLDAMRRSGVQLFNWNQLPNHFHFNVATPDGNLAEFMQRLLTRYAKYFNFTYRLVGHVFQGRYGAKLVDQDAYFKEIIRYVELNAYRISGRPLAPLGKWRWSSLHYRLQPESAWPEGCQTAFQCVLETFSQDPLLSRQQLTQFLAAGLKSGMWEDFYRPKDGRFIGNDDYVERTKSRQSEPIRQVRRLVEGRRSLDQLVQAVQTAGGPSRRDLAAPGKKSYASRWRQALVYIARRHFRISVVQLAKLLGRRESSISMIIARATDEIAVSPEAVRLLEILAPPSAKCEM